MSPAPRETAEIIDEADASLLDVIDNLLNRGVVVNGDVMLSLARVDLVYLRLSALLCAADRVFPFARRRPALRQPRQLRAPSTPPARARRNTQGDGSVRSRPDGARKRRK